MPVGTEEGNDEAMFMGMGSRLLSDLPETEDRNLWSGLQSLRDRLVEEIDEFPDTSPVLINGGWGAGKTTLLLGMQRRLDEATSGDEIPRTVFFEAWRYEGESLLLPALLRAIWEKNPGKGDLRTNWWDAAVTVVAGIGPSLAKMAGGQVAPLVAALLALLRHEKEAVPSGPQEDATKELRDAFRELLGQWTPERPLVVFIDDLDRCSPAGAVALLDAVRMLLNQTASSGEELPCRFVVALDRTVLAQAVARKFADVSRYEGNRYLEKIFPIIFDLPRPEGTAIHQFVTTFLQAGRRQGSASVSEPTGDAAPSVSQPQDEGEKAEHDQLDALSLALSDRIFANPRLMKRCINRFRLVMTFEVKAKEDKKAKKAEETQHGDGDAPLDVDREEQARQLVVLAKWIAATERWPHLRRLLARRRDDYWRRLREFLIDSEKTVPDAEARELLKDEGVEIWLRREMLGGKGPRITDYREADRRLREWGL